MKMSITKATEELGTLENKKNETQLEFEQIQTTEKNIATEVGQLIETEDNKSILDSATEIIKADALEKIQQANEKMNEITKSFRSLEEQAKASEAVETENASHLEGANNLKKGNLLDSVIAQIDENINLWEALANAGLSGFNEGESIANHFSSDIKAIDYGRRK